MPPGKDTDRHIAHAIVLGNYEEKPVHGKPYVHGLDDTCGGDTVISSLVSNTDTYGWVQYIKATVEWRDPYGKAVGAWTNDMQDGDNPLDPTDDNKNANPWYENYGSSTSADGTTVTAMTDNPGWPKRNLDEANANPKDMLAKILHVAGKSSGALTWAKLTFDFDVLLVNVSTRRVEHEWTWQYWIAVDLNKTPAVTTDTTEPKPVR